MGHWGIRPWSLFLPRLYFSWLLGEGVFCRQEPQRQRRPRSVEARHPHGVTEARGILLPSLKYMRIWHLLAMDSRWENNNPEWSRIWTSVLSFGLYIFWEIRLRIHTRKSFTEAVKWSEATSERENQRQRGLLITNGSPNENQLCLWRLRVCCKGEATANILSFQSRQRRRCEDYVGRPRITCPWHVENSKLNSVSVETREVLTQRSGTWASDHGEVVADLGYIPGIQFRGLTAQGLTLDWAEAWTQLLTGNEGLNLSENNVDFQPHAEDWRSHIRPSLV